MTDRTLDEAEAENAGLRLKLAGEQGKIKQMAFAGVTKAVGERQVEVIISTSDEDRDRDVVVPAGISLKNYNKNPIVLFQHDARRPVARTIALSIGSSEVMARAQFPAAGMCEDSDEVYNLVKEMILNTASIGFIPKVWEPRMPEAPWAGQTYKEVELVEWSFVSVPSNPNAVVIGRSLGQELGKFFSWTSPEGLTFGQIERMTSEEVHLQIWKLVDGTYLPSEEKMCFPAEQAAVELAAFQGFNAPEQKSEETACAGDEEARKSAKARLRAVQALRLRTNEI